jgi:uncharacterized protein (TIGR02117 family)
MREEWRIRQLGRQGARLIGWAAAVLMCLILAYTLAGLIGGAIPANRDWRPPEQGITIYIESNGVHTDLVVPVRAAGVDWARVVRPEHFGDPRYTGYDHLAFGWGERTFYLETPTWADVRARTVLAAATGSDETLVHVEYLPEPVPAADVRKIVLRPEEYRRLAAFIRASIDIGAGGQLTVFPGYRDFDAFYGAKGHYDALWTCNAWTGAALRHAGVRVGMWTPFPVTVMRWF